MSFHHLTTLDLTAGTHPDSMDDPRVELIAWYRYQRHEFQRKLRDLSPEQLVSFPTPPVQLSVMGLVRHMTQMEEGYVVAGLLGGTNPMRYGEDDYSGASLESLDEDLTAYFAATEVADATIAAIESLETEGLGSRRSLRWTLVKMIDEYALHAGQAHMLRYAALGEVRR